MNSRLRSRSCRPSGVGRDLFTGAWFHCNQRRRRTTNLAGDRDAPDAVTTSSRKSEEIHISEKPPLVNWLVAASFRIFGVRNEWTARLPSAVIVLAVAVAFVTVARASLGPGGSIIAALIWMTNIGMIEKGRLIEIEALYVSLCGLAIIFWLSFFFNGNLRGSFGFRHPFF